MSQKTASINLILGKIGELRSHRKQPYMDYDFFMEFIGNIEKELETILTIPEKRKEENASYTGKHRPIYDEVIELSNRKIAGMDSIDAYKLYCSLYWYFQNMTDIMDEVINSPE